MNAQCLVALTPSRSSRFTSRLLSLPAALALTLLHGCHWVNSPTVDATIASNGTRWGTSSKPSVSADGRYIAFKSSARNLAAGDLNGMDDIFVHDTLTGTNRRASVNSAGIEGNSYSDDPVLSADGRFVAFYSTATNLAGDRSGVFVHDTQTGTTTRASVNSAGDRANEPGRQPSLSGDGRYVAFASTSKYLVPGDNNGSEDIFVRDTLSGTTARVSVSSSGVEANLSSTSPAMSADGRYVAFISVATNLVTGDTNSVDDVFVHDRQTGTTTRVSVNSAGVQGSDNSDSPVISADGRFVAFVSYASNLVAGDTNATYDIFLHNTRSGKTTRVSVNDTGVGGNGSSANPTMSADGRYIAFDSVADNLVAGDTNGSNNDVFIHDRKTDTTTRASLDPSGAEANWYSREPALSSDGRYVAFYTRATNLVPGDKYNNADIIIRAVPQLAVTAVVPDHLPIGATTPVTVSGEYFLSGTVPSITGAQLSNILIVDENTITMDVTIAPTQTVGARTLYMNQFGTGPGALTGVAANCVNCVTFQ